MHFKEIPPAAGDTAGQDALDAPTMWAATGFGSTGSAGGSGENAGHDASLGAVFDVCHVGVVLRVILGVQGVVWLAALYGAQGAMAWLASAAAGSAEALPACLLWLVGVCGSRRVLGRLPGSWRWGLVGLWGGLAGVYGHVQMSWLAWMLSGIQPWAFWSLIGPFATGVALALVCLSWLHQRQARLLPQQTQARLVELQARIRPHFLFNTLNTAIALVQIDPDRAESVLEDLAELFRRALVSPATQSTLAEEVDLARRYLAIEQQRFGDRLSLSWAIDERANDSPVPILLLQPLVENAVKYGVEADAKGGWVKVQTERQGDRVQVTVSNSLPSGDAAAGAPPRHGHGIALRNLKQRLVLMHDVQAQFEAGPRAIAPGVSERCYVVRCSWPQESRT